MKRTLLALLLFLPMALMGQVLNTLNLSIRSGELWLDDQGKHINAHGGGILKHGDTYYWFGEHKSDNTSDALVGVTCYTSKDLLSWHNCGVALSVSDQPGHDIERGCILERPKVIYCPKTEKFCMWFHLELKGKGYNAARYGVAVADRPEGPYEFLYSQRADAGHWPVEFDDKAMAIIDTLDMNHFQKWWTPDWHRAIDQGLFVKRDFEGGQMSRDMTLYVDDDGKAYHIFSSEDNLTLHIAELTDDFLHHSGRYTRMAPAGHNEAPAIFKRNGTYWMITSGCTGWEPNEARMFSASSIWGPWTQHPNPCIGPKAEKTFGGQSTFILPLGNDQYIFMADIWRPRHPSDARYIWLPIEFKNDKPVIYWRDNWRVEYYFYDLRKKPTLIIPPLEQMVQGRFYIEKVKKHKKYIAVYSKLDGEYKKITGKHGSLIEKLEKGKYYTLYLERWFPNPELASWCLITKVGDIPLEHKKDIYELFSLVSIMEEH